MYRQVLVLGSGTVEGAQGVVGDTAERGEPDAEAVPEVSEHRVLVVVQAPLILRVHLARR